MTAHEYVFGLVDTRSQTRRPPVIGMQFLHERPVSARNLFARSAFLKPKNFVSFVLGHHGQTAARASSAPRVRTTMTCWTPAGKPAIQIRL